LNEKLIVAAVVPGGAPVLPNASTANAIVCWNGCPKTNGCVN
jgi:hypothetical protein